MVDSHIAKSVNARWAAGPELTELLDGLPARTRDAVVTADRNLRTATQSLRDAMRVLHADAGEVWPGYARNVESALLHLECEMRMAAVQLGVARAQSASELRDVVDQAGTTWRSMTDELLVQAHLGQMGARELTDRLGAEVGRVEHQIQSTLESLTGSITASITRAPAEVLGSLRDDAADAVDQIRHALRGIGLGGSPSSTEVESGLAEEGTAGTDPDAPT